MISQKHFKMDDKEKKDFELALKDEKLTLSKASRTFAKKSTQVSPSTTPRLEIAIKSQDYVEFDDPEKGLKWLNH